jgi:hypothetical protein
MAGFKLIAMSNPSPGRDQECGQWYDGVHLRDMVALPGVISAQRFELLRGAPSKAFKQYLAIYDIEAADEREARQVIDRINAANLTLSEALNVQSVNLGVYHESGPPVTRGQVQWLVIVGVLSLGLGISALIGLLTVAKELFCDSSLDAKVTDAGGAIGRHDVGGRASARRCVVTR